MVRQDSFEVIQDRRRANRRSTCAIVSKVCREEAGVEAKNTKPRIKIERPNKDVIKILPSSPQ